MWNEILFETVSNGFVFKMSCNYAIYVMIYNSTIDSKTALWVGYRIDPLPCHACRKRRLRQEQLAPRIKGLV